MIIAIDTETRGLNTKEFVMGCIVKNNLKSEVFKKKEDMWNKILKLGEKEHKQGKVLYVYGHNHNYDFLTYADYLDPQIIIYNSSKPFILARSHEKTKKEYIKFLDSMSLFPMSLSKLGEMLGYEKYDTPEELIRGDKKISKEKLEEIETYMIRDAEIVIKSIQYLKQKIKSEGIGVRRLYTINQISINNMINKFKEVEEQKNIFRDIKKGEIHWTINKDEVKEAYRGSRVDAFKTGNYNNITYIDVNNLYGWASMNIKFPKLSTEMKIHEPLKYMKTRELLDKVGISKVVIQTNETDKIGILPVRQKIDGEENNYYPYGNKIIIGTYTHEELRYAVMKLGYGILRVEWSVIYEENEENPFQRIIPELYEKRMNETDKFNKYFYKQMMNTAMGKFGQSREYMNYTYDTCEKVEEYKAKGYEVVDAFDTIYIYGIKVTGKPKKYFCPIIPSLINAKARIRMHEEMSKIPKKDLLYTDTDSILFKGNHKHLFKIGSGLGEFKIEHENKNTRIYGKKSYIINEEVKFSGIPKKQIKKEDLETGIINYKQLTSLQGARHLKDIGLFKKKTINLNEIEERNKNNYYILENNKVYKDLKTSISKEVIETIRTVTNEKGL